MTTSLQIPKVENATFNEVRILTGKSVEWFIRNGGEVITEVPLKSYVHLRVSGLDRVCLFELLVNEYAFTKQELESYALLADQKGKNYLIKIEDLVGKTKKEKLMKMNKELLVKAWVELKGDLNNTAMYCTTDEKLFVSVKSGMYITLQSLPDDDPLFTYICTVEEFNNYKPTSALEYILRTKSNSKHLAESIKQLETVRKSKSPCQTKANLREAKGTISAMETFMEEVGVLEAWNDNKDLYLEGK